MILFTLISHILQVQSLDGFGRFVAIGTLDLSNNQLSWFELSKLQHLHILDLRLHGNSQLEKDPYCMLYLLLDTLGFYRIKKII